MPGPRASALRRDRSVARLHHTCYHLAGKAASGLKEVLAAAGLGALAGGALAGTAVLPGIGTAVGAVIGGIAGLFGAEVGGSVIATATYGIDAPQTLLALRYRSAFVDRREYVGYRHFGDPI